MNNIRFCDVTEEQAIVLITEKAAKGPAKKKGRKKAPAKKAAAKKAPAKKVAASKKAVNLPIARRVTP